MCNVLIIYYLNKCWSSFNVHYWNFLIDYAKLIQLAAKNGRPHGLLKIVWFNFVYFWCLRIYYTQLERSKCYNTPLAVRVTHVRYLTWINAIADRTTFRIITQCVVVYFNYSILQFIRQNDYFTGRAIEETCCSTDVSSWTGHKKTFAAVWSSRSC